MGRGFGTCVFKFTPEGCGNLLPDGQCAATTWELVSCYMKRYRNRLSSDGGLRLVEVFVHLVLDNEDEETWEEDAPGLQ